MNTRKIIAVAIALFIFTIAFSGCASKQTTNQETTGVQQTTAAQQTTGAQQTQAATSQNPYTGTTIKFSSFQADDVAKDWTDVEFKAFEKETGIKVEHVFIKHEDTISTLMTWAAAGTAPDCSMISADYENSLAANGLLVNLDEYIKAKDPNYDLTRYHEKLLDTYRYQGALYALPSDMDLAVLWYNRDMFDKAGVAYPPKEGWTWDQYRDAAMKLTSGKGPAKIYGSTMPDYQLVIWSNGGDILSADGKQCIINSPEAKEALQKIADSVLVDKFAIDADTVEDDPFQLKHAAMYFGRGPWYAHYVLADVDFKWDFAPLPRLKDEATTTYGSSFAILKSSKNTDASWEFIKWFLSDEQQTNRADKFAWFPPAKTVANSDAFMKDGVMGMTADQKSLVLSLAQYGKHPIVVQKQTEVQTVLDRELSLVWTGKKSVDDAVAAIMKDVPGLLN